MRQLGTGGVISPSGFINVSSGSNQTFNIFPSPGYYISDVLVDGMSAGQISTYVFTNITTTHWIHASFGVSVGNYTINATASDGGTITPSGAVVVQSGKDQTFMIIPDVGRSVAEVLVDSNNVGALTSYTFTNLSKNHMISASFSRIPGEYAINSSSNQWGENCSIRRQCLS